MQKIMYDLDKLAEKDIINTGVATRFFYTIQDYFDKLTEFTQHYQSYIQHYNPTVVVVSEVERNVFIAACASVRALLTQLGMNAPINELNALENAALAGEIKVLSDGIIVFHGLLEIAAQHILAAKIEPGTVPVNKKIMLVHDDSITLKCLNAMLNNHYTVVTMSGGSAAIKALESHVPDLFLIYTEMRGICGYQLAFFIREHNKFSHAPIVFLHGREAHGDAHYELPINEIQYIYLPIKKNELLEKINKEF